MIGIWNGEIINFDFMTGNLDALGSLPPASPADPSEPDEPTIIDKE